MFRLSIIAIAACASALTAAPAAQAADMPAPIPEAVLQGWYLRGDIGYSNQQVDSLDNAIYDLPGITVVDNVSAEFDGGGTFGGGIGYRFNNWFRADVTGEYRMRTDFSGLDLITAPGNPVPTTPNYYEAKKAEWLAMANGYVDLGSWHGISPFVGGGVGFANVEISGFTDIGVGSTGAPSIAFGADHDEWNFAWALHAGVGFEITPALTLEFAYRYLDMGDAESGDLIAYDGTNNFDNPMIFEDLTSHDLKLGVRYAFY